METLLRAVHSDYANERWVPAPAPVKPASPPLFPGPWLHVFSSLTLRVWFLLNKAFPDG